MFTFRDFLYLDERTVKRYLSSIEKGLVKEVMETDINAQPSWDFEVSSGKLQQLLNTAGIPVPNVGVKRNGQNETVSVQITKEPTIDSQFDQLFSYIQPVLQYLDEFNVATWSQIEEGQFIYYPSEITLPKGYEDTQVVSKTAELYDLVKNWHKDEQFEKLMDESEEYRKEFTSTKYTNIYSIPTATPNKKKYYFVAKIIHDNLVESSLEDLTFGKAYTLARVEHVIDVNEKYPVFDLTFKGMDKVMNRQQRRQQKNDLLDVATKPAIVVRPIAIFRK